jgi:flagellin-like hook-associated protein FlgL
MAITSVNVGRVSQNMQTNLMLQGMQRNMVQLLQEQERLSTGLQIVRPSDDPIKAAATIRMDEILEAQNQYLANIKNGVTVMDIADNTLSSIFDLTTQAHTLANESVDSTSTEETRHSNATLIDSILGQMVTLGNTEYLGSFLFAGESNTTAPFSKTNNRVTFSGNQTSLKVQVSQDITEDLTLTSQQVFGTGLGQISGYQDLTPAANANTRLSDISGTLGQGIRLSTMTITGSTIGQYDVDLTGCSSLGDVINKVNDVLPASTTIGLSADGRSLELTSVNPGETLAITETGHGTVAHDLGLYTPVAQVGPINGGDLKPKISLYTPVSSLNGGTGIDLTSGLIITNGENTVTVDFSSSQTMQDVINAINTSGTNVRAQINSSQNGIDIVSTVSGTKLTIGENGGTTAEDLGIRTLRAETKLSTLNGGLGVNTVDGADFRITASNGSTLDVDVSSATTMQNVIDLINAQATANGVAVTASIATVGNGIVLTDNTGGAGDFKVERMNLSNAAEDLGILQTVTAGNSITGEDVNATQEESIFTYLINLREALKANDVQGMEQAAQKIEAYTKQLEEYQGKLGYMARGLEMRSSRTEDAVLSTKTLLSSLKDLDYSEAIVKFQTLQTTLQANMQLSSQLMKTSLLDYI